MLKEDVTYENPFTGEKVTQTLYFNLSKAEILDILTEDEAYVKQLESLSEQSSMKDLLGAIKFFMRRAYGQRDGDSFIKNEFMSEQFMKSEAYSTYIFSLFSTPDKAASFVNGVMPAELLAAAKTEGKRPPLTDHLPKQVKDVELPPEEEHTFEDSLAEIRGIEEDDRRTRRLEELKARPANELSLDELIELRKFQDD